VTHRSCRRPNQTDGCNKWPLSRHCALNSTNDNYNYVLMTHSIPEGPLNEERRTQFPSSRTEERRSGETLVGSSVGGHYLLQSLFFHPIGPCFCFRWPPVGGHHLLQSIFFHPIGSHFALLVKLVPDTRLLSPSLKMDRNRRLFKIKLNLKI
jgi:hypothetical protein